VAISEESKDQSTKIKYSHIVDIYEVLQEKKKHFSRHEPVTYLIFLLREIMRYSWDISCPLSIQEAAIMLMEMKMNHRLHMVALFKDGLIRLVVTL
jgi:hypothetical protein